MIKNETPLRSAKTEKRMKWKILVVDDSSTTRWLLTDHFNDLGYASQGASSSQEALDLVNEGFKPDLAVLDIELPDLSGIDLLPKLQEKLPNLAAIMLTVHDRATLAVRALQAGACEYVLKPFNLEDFTQLVLGILRDKRGSTVESSEQSLEEPSKDLLIANSEVMKQAQRRIAIAAQAEGLTVLITGESGTGKELVAKSIHERSSRQNQPFIVVTCTALPETLVESLLFGHEIGAFTGATELRRGYFEQADNGTLFLDEVGGLPLSIQAKFLRILETSEITRLGGEKEIKVNVRVIATTNQDLSELVRNMAFRQDLFWRLAVLTIDLPPLRARGNDVVLIAREMLRRNAIANNNTPKKLSIAALEKIRSHCWPGNIRELYNVIERAIILTRSPLIEAKDLILEDEQRSHSCLLENAIQKNLTLRELEARYMLRILEDSGWHRGEAAKKLGVDPKTLYRFLKQREAE